MNTLILEQYEYVRKVIVSCETEQQRESALQWAEDWAKQMNRLFPKEIASWPDLYLSVTSF